MEDFLILGCSRCSHLEIGTVFLYDLYLAVFISMSGCCVWDAEHWILREVTLAVAQCLARRWLHVLRQYLAFGRIAHIFYVAMDSNPEVSWSSFSRRMEQSAQPMLQFQSWLRCSHQEISRFFHESHVTGGGDDVGWRGRRES